MKTTKLELSKWLIVLGALGLLIGIWFLVNQKEQNSSPILIGSFVSFMLGVVCQVKGENEL